MTFLVTIKKSKMPSWRTMQGTITLTKNIHDEYNQVKDVVVSNAPPRPDTSLMLTETIPPPSSSTAPSVPVKERRVKTFIPPPMEVKKAVGPMTEADKADNMWKLDAEILAARKAKFDAARFTNFGEFYSKAQYQAVVFQEQMEEQKIPGAKLPSSSTQESTIPSSSRHD
jgi:hypothetical protein